MNEESLGIIAECYVSYCSVIKPLIAQIEARSEKLPLQLFNEIRAFNGWTISVIASAIISAIFSCELVSRFF